ncbi:MAG: cupredoxin domain-containing protein [Gemmatirosa sp.]
MSPIDWLVLGGGAAGIAWVNWYFFLAERAASVAAPTGGGGEAGAQAATIVVRGGYAPAVVRVRAGRPVRLTFDRQETAGCSEEVVFGDFGVRRYLPAHARTVVEVTPPAPGTYEFTCGMGMLRGKLVAE